MFSRQSSHLSASHSHDRTSDSPTQAEVNQSAREALENDNISMQMIAFLNQYEAQILHLMRVQVEIIEQREESVGNDGLYFEDRVMLALGRHEDFKIKGSSTYFCQHYLGYNVMSGEVNDAMHRAVNIPVLSQPTATAVSSAIFQSTAPISSSTNVDPTSPKEDPITRLMTTYEIACQEYYEVIDFRNDHTLKAAKYLRDTAENAVLYLKGTDMVDHHQLQEFTNTYEQAKHMVEDLTGGKVRKFDEGGDAKRRDSGYQAGKDRQGMEKSRHVNHRAVEAEGHGRRDEGHGHRSGGRREEGHAVRRGPRRSMSPSDRRVEVERERGREARDNRATRQRPQPRGHSGVPFGYTREVDSYKPTK